MMTLQPIPRNMKPSLWLLCEIKQNDLILNLTPENWL